MTKRTTMILIIAACVSIAATGYVAWNLYSNKGKIVSPLNQSQKMTGTITSIVDLSIVDGGYTVTMTTDDGKKITLETGIIGGELPAGTTMEPCKGSIGSYKQGGTVEVRGKLKGSILDLCGSNEYYLKTVNK